MAAPETLPPDEAVSLFYNGHRLAKEGDPPSKWIAMNRLSDGSPVLVTPMPEGMEQVIKDGEFYLAEGVTDWEEEPPTEPPTNVDVPYVSAVGARASCTMGNWKNEPSSYAYAWQRDGSPISGAASANEYDMVTADKGKAIGCIVSATNAAGTTEAPLSNTVVGP